MLPWALLLLSQAELPMWTTFEVVNPAQAGGHTILHLEDMLGTKETVSGVPRPAVLVLFSVDEEGCPPKPGGVCAVVGQITQAKGVLAVAVLLGSAEVANRARRKLALAPYPFPISVDPHGLIAKGLKLNRPGGFIVVNSDGALKRLSPPPRVETWSTDQRARYWESVRTTILGAIRREKEQKE